MQFQEDVAAFKTYMLLDGMMDVLEKRVHTLII